MREIILLAAICAGVLGVIVAGVIWARDDELIGCEVIAARPGGYTAHREGRGMSYSPAQRLWRCKDGREIWR